MDLATNFLLYLLLLLAVVLGYFLGRREKSKSHTTSQAVQDYYQGLNLLLRERPELSIDRFVQSIEANDESVDGHLAIAAVVRRRGEVDKAIRVHQHLLASPKLSESHKQLVEYELGRDFFAAGLLDRAETILTRVIARSDDQLAQAQALLLDLYEQEREWHKALAVGMRMLSDSDEVVERLGHHHCEIAEHALANGDLIEAQEHIAAARRMAPKSPRGHGLAARIEHAKQRFKRVVKHCERCLELQPDLVADYVDLYRDACVALEREADFKAFLGRLIERFPEPVAISALWEAQGPHAQSAIAEFVGYVKQGPTRRHIPLLLDWLPMAEPAEAQEIRRLLEQVASNESQFQCHNCGFRTHQHLWHCPTCKSWGCFAAYT